MDKQFTITIETDITSEFISSHDTLIEAKEWVSIYLHTKAKEYEKFENAMLVISDGVNDLQMTSFWQEI
jgi:hypothetical protein